MHVGIKSYIARRNAALAVNKRLVQIGNMHALDSQWRSHLQHWGFHCDFFHGMHTGCTNSVHCVHYPMCCLSEKIVVILCAPSIKHAYQ